MSDWGGTAHFVRSHNYGLDVEMPCLIDRSKDLLRAIRAGKLDRHAVKTTAERIIALSKRVKIQSDKAFDYSEDKAAEVALQAGLAQERQLFTLLAATEDRHEGISAFLQKRTPDFKGR